MRFEEYRKHDAISLAGLIAKREVSAQELLETAIARAPGNHRQKTRLTDGNDVAGIRLPDLTVPLATHTGWNLRHPQIGASGQLLNLIGASVAFASTKQEREARGDPRPSIAERYPSRDAYLGQVRQAAQQLVEDGYLLAEDLGLLVDQAAERFDVFARPSAGATS